MLDRQRAGGNVGVIAPALAPAGLERRRRREDRQLLVVGALHGALDVGHLGVGDDLHRGIVGHQREVAVDRRAAFGHLAAHVLQRLRVFGGDQAFDHGVGVDQGFLGGAVEDRADVRAAVDDLPTAGGVVQREVDHAEVVAPAARHDRGHAVDGAALEIDLGMAGKSLAREFGVRVAEQDGVDADHFGELGNGVFA